MDAALQGALEQALDAAIVASTRIHGGDVAIAFRVELHDGRRVFAKTHAAPPPRLFTTEAASLAWLRDAGAVLVPEVLAVADPAGHGGGRHPALLALEWVEQGDGRAGSEEAFGAALARLHLASSRCFGREDARPTGSRSLPNDPCTTWAEFYRERRLLPLARLARDSGALPARAVLDLEAVARRLEEVGAAEEPPARLHGDLWAGNRIVDASGRSWLIDPAAHGGHREFDLAMMRLFGGFGPACFAAYEAVTPLAEGWRERVPLHQLAPLVVHAIKFGGGYVGAAQEAIARSLSL
jgi:fructosamine-3-kinase